MGATEVPGTEEGELMFVLLEGGVVGVVVTGAAVPCGGEEGGTAEVAGLSLAVGSATVAGIVGSSGAEVGEGVTGSIEEGLGTSELDVSSTAEPVGSIGSCGLRVVKPWVGRAVDTTGTSTLDESSPTELVGFERSGMTVNKTAVGLTRTSVAPVDSTAVELESSADWVVSGSANGHVVDPSIWVKEALF